MSSRSRRRFTPQFKAEAVEMVEAVGGNVAKVAKQLGIYDSTLGNWVRQAREQAQGAPSAEERAAIRELCGELELTRRKRDILAKRCPSSRSRWYNARRLHSSLDYLTPIEKATP